MSKCGWGPCDQERLIRSHYCAEHSLDSATATDAHASSSEGHVDDAQDYQAGSSGADTVARYSRPNEGTGCVWMFPLLAVPIALVVNLVAAKGRAWPMVGAVLLITIVLGALIDLTFRNDVRWMPEWMWLPILVGSLVGVTYLMVSGVTNSNRANPVVATNPPSSPDVTGPQQPGRLSYQDAYDAAIGGCHRGALEDDGVMDQAEADFCDAWADELATKATGG